MCSPQSSTELSRLLSQADWWPGQVQSRLCLPSSAKPAAELQLPAEDEEHGGTDSVPGIKEAGLQGQGSQACCRELDWQMNN